MLRCCGCGEGEGVCPLFYSILPSLEPPQLELVSEHPVCGPSPQGPQTLRAAAAINRFECRGHTPEQFDELRGSRP